ncbi:MAG: hypothetical protein IJK64_09115 [Clostridia bacterium]|nr:hypothetical protein [Clostridia bacterium]
MREEGILRAACRTAEEEYWQVYFAGIDAEPETTLPKKTETRLLTACGFLYSGNGCTNAETTELKTCHPGKMLKAMLIVALLALFACAVSASEAAPTVAPCDFSMPATNEIIGISPSDLSSSWTKARATNGACGYVREAELAAFSPSSPEDAGWQRRMRNKHKINVYAEDGMTILGQYIVSAQ